MRFDNKVAVVTGGGSGMGLATAKALAAEGARVAICGRGEDRLKAAATGVGPADRVLAVAADVTRPPDLDRFYDAVAARFGPIDLLFANAGVGDPTPIDDVDEATFDKITGINFKGVFFAVQRAVTRFNPAGGAIVINASLTQHQGVPELLVYAATKAAVSQLARGFAGALLPRGIRVNAVSPGVIATDMTTSSVGEEQVRTLDRQIPAGRLGEADEVAKAVLFLLSDDASYVAGEDLLVDGGRIRLNPWQR